MFEIHLLGHAVLFSLADVTGSLIMIAENQRYFMTIKVLGIPLILCFYLIVKKFFFPLIPLGEYQGSMGVPKRQKNLLQNISENLFALKIAKGASYQLIHS